MLLLPTLYLGVHKLGAPMQALTEDLQQFFYGRFPTTNPRISVDGNFGQQTKSFVERFQRLERVEADGVVGPTTWGKLLAAGFRPSEFETTAPPGDPTRTAAWPPKPQSLHRPGGRALVGAGFSYRATPTLTNPERITVDAGWVFNNITQYAPPELAGVRGGSLISINRKVLGQFKALLKAWQTRGLLNRIRTFDGCWAPRFIRGSTTSLSNHAFGTAFDINSQWNPYKSEPALVGKDGCVRELVEDALAYGFYWGGWFNDGMHFEAYRIDQGT